MPYKSVEQRKAHHAAYRAAHHEEMVARDAAYYSLHKAEFAAYGAKRYLLHGSEMRARAAKYQRAHRAEILVKKRDHYAANRASERARSAEYQRTHVNELRAYRATNAKRIAKRKAAFYSLHRGEAVAYRTAYNAALKAEVLQHYGGGHCSKCDEARPDYLDLHHVNGGGRKHVQEIGGGGLILCAWLKKNQFPDGFEPLCLTHHREATIAARKPGRTSQAARDAALRLEAIQHYGGKCARCDESRPEYLDIHHSLFNGAAHRREIGGTRHLCSWLRRNNYPKGFELLCPTHHRETTIEHRAALKAARSITS